MNVEEQHGRDRERRSGLVDLRGVLPGPIQDATDSILDGRPPLFAVFDLFFGFFFIRTR
jgi:hypothetical protein